MLFTPWLAWSQCGGACSLSSVQGDIALIKLSSVASTPDFIAGWSQLFPGTSSKLFNAVSETCYDAQCHSCRFSKGTRFKIQIMEWEGIWLTILACVHRCELITKLSYFCNNMRRLFQKWKNLIFAAHDTTLKWVFNPRPLRPKGYCRHLRLSVCLSVPIILVNTITQSVYPISLPNLLGGFNMTLSRMVL